MIFASDYSFSTLAFEARVALFHFDIRSEVASISIFEASRATQAMSKVAEEVRICAPINAAHLSQVLVGMSILHYLHAFNWMNRRQDIERNKITEEYLLAIAYIPPPLSCPR